MGICRSEPKQEVDVRHEGQMVQLKEMCIRLEGELNEWVRDNKATHPRAIQVKQTIDAIKHFEICDSNHPELRFDHIVELWVKIKNLHTNT
jgi:hypothetical protein